MPFFSLLRKKDIMSECDATWPPLEKTYEITTDAFNLICAAENVDIRSRLLLACATSAAHYAKKRPIVERDVRLAMRMMRR